MTAQLNGRKERLSWLVGFINENAALLKVSNKWVCLSGRSHCPLSTQMSQSSRQQLAMDAEKLYASHQLWLNYNRHLPCVILMFELDNWLCWIRHHSSSSFQSVLKEAVMKYMEEIGESTQEDVMRVFFRSRVADIGKLLSKVSDVVVAVSKPSTGNVNALLSEANSVVVVSFYSQNIPI